MASEHCAVHNNGDISLTVAVAQGLGPDNIAQSDVCLFFDDTCL